MVTESIGDYRITSRLSVGGMSEVFLACDPAGERVVIKVLLPQHQALPDARAAFEHEAKLGQKLTHPNLVKTKDHGTSILGPYLVLEWVDGVNVARLLASKERFTAAEVLVLALDLLGALQHLHGAKGENGAPLHIVHRDISPDNVMVDGTGKAKLLDFGIARSALRETRTRTGFVRGKLRYLSPEQATGSDLDGRSDLYSLAAVLYEMATGQPHLRGATDLELLRCAEDPVFEKPSQWGADVCLDAFLERALSRFAEDRYPSAKAMEKGARECLRTVGEDALALARTAMAKRAKMAAEQPESPPVVPPAAPGPAESDDLPPDADKPSPESPKNTPMPGASKQRANTLRWAHVGVFLAGAAAVWLIKPAFERLKTDKPPADASVGSMFPPAASSPSSPLPLLSPGFVASLPSAEPITAASHAPSADVPSARDVPSLAGDGARSVVTALERVSAPAPSTSTATAVAVPSSVAVTPEPATSSASETSTPGVPAAPKPSSKEAAAAKMAAVSARLKAAKSKGHNVARLEARAVVALQAYLDGRYDDTERALDKIAAEIPQ